MTLNFLDLCIANIVRIGQYFQLMVDRKILDFLNQIVAKNYPEVFRDLFLEAVVVNFAYFHLQDRKKYPIEMNKINYNIRILNLRLNTLKKLKHKNYSHKEL